MGKSGRRIAWIVLVPGVVAATVLLVVQQFPRRSVDSPRPVAAVPAPESPAAQPPAAQPPAGPEPATPSGAAARPAPVRTVAAAGPLRGVALSPDGVSVAVSADDHVWIWNIATGELMATIDLDGCGGTDLAYHPLKSLLAVGCRDGRVWLWESSSHPAATIRTGHRDRITDVTFGPDGCLLATASVDGTVEVWDVGTGERVGSPIDVEALSPGTLRTGGVQSVAFDPGGTMLAIPAGQRVSIWTIADRAVTRVIDIGDLAVSVAYNSDGRGLLIGNAVGTGVFRWLNDSVTAQGPRITGGDGYLYRVAWTRDDRYVLAGSGRTVQVWDTSGGAGPGASLPGGPNFAISRDGRTIATFEPAGSTLLLWSTRTAMPYLR